MFQKLLRAEGEFRSAPYNTPCIFPEAVPRMTGASASSPASSSAPISASTPNNTLSTNPVPVSSSSTLLPSSQQRRELSGCPEAVELLLELQDATATLPGSVPDGEEVDENPFHKCAREPASFIHPNEDSAADWEIIDPILNKATGLGKTVFDIAPTIRREAAGVDGLLQFLTYFVEEGGLVGHMIEGKVERIWEAIKFLFVVFQLRRSPEDLTNTYVRTMSGRDDDEARVAAVDVTTATDALHNPSANAIHRSPGETSKPPPCSGAAAGSTDAGVNADIVLENGDGMTESTKPPCNGIVITFPAGQDPFCSYPFGLSTLGTPSRGTSTSSMASSAFKPDPNNTVLKGMLRRLEEGIHENTPHHYQPTCCLST